MDSNQSAKHPNEYRPNINRIEAGRKAAAKRGHANLSAAGKKGAAARTHESRVAGGKKSAATRGYASLSAAGRRGGERSHQRRLERSKNIDKNN